MERFLTYEKELHSIECMTEAEFHMFKQSDRYQECNDWEEWVWQFGPSKDAAIAAHDAKMDEWRENPNKETY